MKKNTSGFSTSMSVYWRATIPKWAFILPGEVEKDDSPSQGSRKPRTRSGRNLRGRTQTWGHSDGLNMGENKIILLKPRFIDFEPCTCHFSGHSNWPLPLLEFTEWIIKTSMFHCLRTLNLKARIYHLAVENAVGLSWSPQADLTPCLNGHGILHETDTHSHIFNAQAIFRDSWENRSQNGGFHIWSSGKLGAGWWGVANGVKWRLENDSIRLWFFFWGMEWNHPRESNTLN